MTLWGRASFVIVSCKQDVIIEEEQRYLVAQIQKN